MTATIPTDSTTAGTVTRTALDQTLVARFLAGQVGPEAIPEPQWGPIGREVYERTYSRVIDTPDGPRNETWAETVRRVVLGNLGYSPRSSWLPDEAVELFELIYDFKASPAGRHLWVTGTTSPYSRNCWTSGWSERTSDHVAFLASRLFEGGGVGANYSADLMSATTPIYGRLSVRLTCRADHPDIAAIRTAAGDAWVDPAEVPDVDRLFSDVWTVEDSREGWVATWVRMIDLVTKETREASVVVDVSDVRPYGAPLRTFGGKASGPAPLITAILGLNAVLRGARGRRLTGLEAMQIDHEIAASVVAGGTRRSARMSLMNWADPEIFDFLACKADHTQHWTTNISVEIDVAFRDAVHASDPHALKVLGAVAEGMAANGEPGFVDTEAHTIGEPVRIRNVNPCGEASLSFDPADGAGESCNLGSVNLAAFGTDIHGATRAFMLMARFLYRATLNPYPGEAPSRIEARNRRIGVGIMGLQGWLAEQGVKLTELAGHAGLRETLTGFRLASRRAADSLADQLCLPRPVKVTAVAPTGTIAQLSGTTPGIHPVFARHYLRRVRYSDSDAQLPDLEAKGYNVVDDVYAANTKVVEFPQQDALAAKYGPKLIEQSDEVSFGQFMELVAAVQETFCGDTDGQAVSATAQIPAGMDPQSLAFDMEQLLGKVKGITAFPDASGRMLAPYERITQAEFDEHAARLFYADLALLTGDSNGNGDCATGACPVR